MLERANGNEAEILERSRMVQPADLLDHFFRRRIAHQLASSLLAERGNPQRKKMKIAPKMQICFSKRFHLPPL